MTSSCRRNARVSRDLGGISSAPLEELELVEILEGPDVGSLVTCDLLRSSIQRDMSRVAMAYGARFTRLSQLDEGAAHPARYNMSFLKSIVVTEEIP